MWPSVSAGSVVHSASAWTVRITVVSNLALVIQLVLASLRPEPQSHLQQSPQGHLLSFSLWSLLRPVSQPRVTADTDGWTLSEALHSRQLITSIHSLTFSSLTRFDYVAVSLIWRETQWCVSSDKTTHCNYVSRTTGRRFSSCQMFYMTLRRNAVFSVNIHSFSTLCYNFHLIIWLEDVLHPF